MLGVVGLVGSVAVPMVADDLSVLVVVLALLAVLLTAANLLVTAGTSAHFAALTSIIFERYAHSADYPIRVSPVQPDQFPLFIGNRLAFGLLAAAAVAITLSAWMVNDIQIEDDVLIIAHRGAAGRAPENTLASVQAALEDDADWIEIDVQESADGEVIVVHDSDFMKLSGNPVKVWDVTADQLAGINLGSALLVPDVMMREGDNYFLDDLTPADLEKRLGCRVVIVEDTPWGLLDAIENLVAD